MLFRATRSLCKRTGRSICLLLTVSALYAIAGHAAVAQAQEQAAAERQSDAKQAVLDALRQLKLPDNPSRADSERLIESARGYAEQLNEIGVGFSSSDKSFKTLDQIPPEHVDLLLAEIANDTRLRMYVPASVQAMELEPEAVKQRVIQNLDETPANIAVLIHNGWSEGARSIIMEKILEANDPVSLPWFAAAVDLMEPKLYKKLHELTIQSKDADAMLEMLEALPNYDLLHTLQTVMQRVEDGKLKIKRKTTLSANNIEEIRFKAAENGDLNSLAWLVGKLPDKSTPYPSLWHFVNVRLPVIKLIDFKGDNQQIKAWFKDNRDELAFDKFRKRFVLPEDDF